MVSDSSGAKETTAVKEQHVIVVLPPLNALMLGLPVEPSTVMKLFVATYIIGPVISMLALILIWLYPVNRKVLEQIRAGGGGL